MKYLFVLILFASDKLVAQKFTILELISFINMDAGKAEDKLQLQKFDVIRKQERGSASAYSYTYWEYNYGNEQVYLTVSVNEELKSVDAITMDLNSKEEYLTLLRELGNAPYEKLDSVYGDRSISEEFKRGTFHIILSRNEVNSQNSYSIEICTNCTIVYKRAVTH